MATSALPYQLKMFKTFSLTRESLGSAEELSDYLRQKSEEGLLKCKSFEVHDVDAWKAKALDFYSGEMIHAPYYGFWKYHLLGRLGTWLSDRELKKKNEQARAEHESRAYLETTGAERAEP